MASRALMRVSAVSNRFARGYASESKSTGLIRLNPETEILSKNEKEHLRLRDSEITVAAVENIGLISGVPEEHIKTRRVRIYRPAKNAMQSGRNNINLWQLDFETRERWENPLMGWTSTGDPMSNMKVDFATEQEAIAHCKKMGWQYYVQKPNIDSPKPRSYGTNFSWNKRTRVSTK